MKKYNQPPIQLNGDFDVIVKEMMYYQYLPIHITGGYIAIPDRLKVFSGIINACIKDFSRGKNWHEYKIYITAKHMFVSPGCNLNRLGWHSDGFGTDDVSYVWSNCLPTLWTDMLPNPPSEDNLALQYFNSKENIPFYRTDPNKIYRLDQYVVHACDITDKPVLRSFVKINFSKDMYDLEGNSHNYLLDYDWEMKPRKEQRNHPQTNIK